MHIEISKTSAESIKKLIDSIPEFYPTPIEEIEKRIADKEVKLFVAKEALEIAGFIIAYQNSFEIYYNWLSGVLPKFRGRAIATKLFEAYEDYAAILGYKTCQVKSMNKFKGMLQLLISRN
ncbi:MAG: GNAT family N-acetyltransferase, partial [Prolixibacteraceae bacterium]|nr:GNAT family N-acetyltransferase [Prolixibacteraceae bacterium]